MGSSPWKRRPHFSMTRREAALVAMVALMIRSNPTVSRPWRTPARPPSEGHQRPGPGQPATDVPADWSASQAAPTRSAIAVSAALR